MLKTSILRSSLAALAVGLFATTLATPAHALPNDVYLLGLVENGQPNNDAFRQFTTELGLVMTPTMLQPAETTGQAGFDFGVDIGVHAISIWDQYWQDGRIGTGLEDRPPFVPTLETIGVRGRKGFVLPLPLTSEIELGAQWIVESRLANVGGKIRLALNEGFMFLFYIPIPDIAVEAGINRLIGTQDLDLTTATFGGTISRSFGLFGDINLCPFIGYQSVFINAASRIIDPNPANTSDIDNTVTFDMVPMVAANNNDPGACIADVANCLTFNRVDRVSVGLRLNVAVVQWTIGLDANYYPGPDWTSPSRTFPILFQGSTRFGLLF